MFRGYHQQPCWEVVRNHDDPYLGIILATEENNIHQILLRKVSAGMLTVLEALKSDMPDLRASSTKQMVGVIGNDNMQIY